MQRTFLVLFAGLLLLAAPGFANDVTIDSSGNIETGTSASVPN